MAKEPEIDWTKVEEAALALLSMTLDGNNRVWKGLSWDITDRLFENGWIFDPKGKAKSVVMTDEGVEKAEAFFDKYFTKQG